MTNRKTICIVHYNTPELTNAAILSIRKQGGEDYQIVIFDNSDKRPFVGCAEIGDYIRYDTTKRPIADRPSISFSRSMSGLPKRRPCFEIFF